MMHMKTVIKVNMHANIVSRREANDWAYPEHFVPPVQTLDVSARLAQQARHLREREKHRWKSTAVR